MIGISTQTYDLNGTRIFQQADIETEASNRTLSRRVTRVATLDGGSVLSDSGAAHGDREILVVEPRADEEAVAWAAYIVENYELVTVAMRDGAFSGCPETYRVNGGSLEINVLVKEKLSA